MSQPLYFEDVEAGAEIPPLVQNATNVAVFLYGVAWWTSHRIHYDKAYAQSEGFDDILVVGGLSQAWLVKMLKTWVGDPGFVRRISTRNLSPAYGGDELTVRGKREEGGERLVDCDVSVEKQGGVLVISGSATLTLPSREG